MKTKNSTIGKVGLAVLAALSLTRKGDSSDDEESEDVKQLRARVVELARAEAGNAEEREYWLEAYGSVPRLGAYAWCGVFALYILHVAGLTQQMWRVGPTDYGFIHPLRLRSTTSPRPGDIAYFSRNQHHAIVLSVGNDEVELCNGNGVNHRVTINRCAKNNVTAFYSIASLIETKLAKVKDNEQ